MQNRSRQIIVGATMIGGAYMALLYLTYVFAYKKGQEDHALYWMTAEVAMDAYKPSVYN